MSARAFTILDDGTAHTVEARFVDGAVRIPATQIRSALGWESKTEGFCKGDVCVPVTRRPEVVSAVGVDLAAFADLLGRPCAIDLETGCAALGVAAAERGAQLRTLQAPDFALPDLDGKTHTLSSHRGKKVLLVAYASW